MIHYLFHASVVGVEMNETFYREAIENLTDNVENFMKKANSKGH